MRRTETALLYLSISIYNFASKPQLMEREYGWRYNCIYLYQYTTLQANHNSIINLYVSDITVFIYINIQLCKQTTTDWLEVFCIEDCIYLYQYTTLQANHNRWWSIDAISQTVFIYINIQLCKQTTTILFVALFVYYCIYLYQYTTLQANHNTRQTCHTEHRTVFIYINIQLCKQTTTLAIITLFISNCIYLYQYTTLQANHNCIGRQLNCVRTVFIYINIQLCKQTTTIANTNIKGY